MGEDTIKDYNDSNNSTHIVENRENVGPGGSKLILNDTVKKK